MLHARPLEKLPQLSRFFGIGSTVATHRENLSMLLQEIVAWRYRPNSIRVKLMYSVWSFTRSVRAGSLVVDCSATYGLQPLGWPTH